MDLSQGDVKRIVVWVALLVVWWWFELQLSRDVTSLGIDLNENTS